jgi:fatty-acyl-CoA synthase/long-chain acyl-CoA synthetase
MKSMSRKPADVDRRSWALSDVIRAHARARADHPAIICEDRQLTYSQLHRESNRTARALLAEGLGPGSRIAFLGKESEFYYDLLYACAKSSMVLVPINWRLTSGEVDHILRDSDAELLLVEQEFLDLVAQLRDALPRLRTVVAADGPAGPGGGFLAWKAGQPTEDLDLDGGPDTPVAQLYTSGTTGLPKGVVLAQRSFFAVRDALDSAGLDWIDWQPADKSLLTVPGFHVGGLWWATQGFNAGITNVAMRMFVSKDAVSIIRRQGITTACVVPAMLQMMLAEPGVTRGDFATLRKVVYGGSPISESLLDRCIATIGCDFAQIYGLTETGNTAVCLPPSSHVPGCPQLKAAGRPYPGIELKVIDAAGTPVPVAAIGEICIKTPARMIEYWRLPDATAQTLIGDWIHTGDAGYLDQDGYLYICDRIKDMIIVAGENVYPAEIENALAKHQAVAEAAVIGVPDERWGEAIYAFVVTKPGEKVTPRELMLFLGTHIAAFKMPALFCFVEQIPRNPSGKILRRVLRDKFWADRESKV